MTWPSLSSDSLGAVLDWSLKVSPGTISLVGRAARCTDEYCVAIVCVGCVFSDKQRLTFSQGKQVKIKVF